MPAVSDRVVPLSAGPVAQPVEWMRWVKETESAEQVGRHSEQCGERPTVWDGRVGAANGDGLGVAGDYAQPRTTTQWQPEMIPDTISLTMMAETDKKLWGRNLLISVLREHSNPDEIDASMRVRLLGLSNGQPSEHLRMEGLHS